MTVFQHVAEVMIDLVVIVFFPLRTLGGQVLTVALLVLFHILGFRRSRAIHMPWLHAAPYVTALSLISLIWVISIYHDDPSAPLFVYPWFFGSYLTLLAWPAAALMLCFKPARKGA